MLHRILRLLGSVADPRAWAHVVRLVHYYNYSYVTPAREVRLGQGAVLAPNVSFRNGSRIAIGAGSQIGTRCSFWAGDSTGRIDVGEKALFGPEVFVIASNYETVLGLPIMDQAKIERDVVIGSRVWLGARVIVLPGVTIGDGCIVGAGAVVTKSLPADGIAVGFPARVVGQREPARVNA